MISTCDTFAFFFMQWKSLSFNQLKTRKKKTYTSIRIDKDNLFIFFKVMIVWLNSSGMFVSDQESRLFCKFLCDTASPINSRWINQWGGVA